MVGSALGRGRSSAGPSGDASCGLAGAVVAHKDYPGTSPTGLQRSLCTRPMNDTGRKSMSCRPIPTSEGIPERCRRTAVLRLASARTSGAMRRGDRQACAPRSALPGRSRLLEPHARVHIAIHVPSPGRRRQALLSRRVHAFAGIAEVAAKDAPGIFTLSLCCGRKSDDHDDDEQGGAHAILPSCQPSGYARGSLAKDSRSMIVAQQLWLKRVPFSRPSVAGRRSRRRATRAVATCSH